MSGIAESSAVTRWQKSFAEDPVLALERLLTGQVNLGPYNRARSADALVQLLIGDEARHTTDTALQTWLEYLLDKPAPKGISSKRFADALVEAFRSVTRIPLPTTKNWLVQRHGVMRRWLRGFYAGPSRDPEASLLVALTQGQVNRSLLGLWLGLTKLSGVAPVRHALIGLAGLRLMPADDQGTTEHQLPKALLRGLLEFGDALVRSGNETGEATWLRELDFFAAAYPMSHQTWAKQFRRVLAARPVSRQVLHWLDQRYPGVEKP